MKLVALNELLVKEGVYETLEDANKALRNGEVRVNNEVANLKTQLFSGTKVQLGIKRLDKNWTPISRYVKRPDITGKKLKVFNANADFEILEVTVRQNV